MAHQQLTLNSNTFIRDASNYKWFNKIVVSGTLTIHDLKKYLIDGEFFVPSAVGLDSLTPLIRNEDDHDWHAIFSLVPTTDPAGSISADEIVRRFRVQHEMDWQ